MSAPRIAVSMLLVVFVVSLSTHCHAAAHRFVYGKRMFLHHWMVINLVNSVSGAKLWLKCRCNRWKEAGFCERCANYSSCNTNLWHFFLVFHVVFVAWMLNLWIHVVGGGYASRLLARPSLTSTKYTSFTRMDIPLPTASTVMAALFMPTCSHILHCLESAQQLHQWANETQRGDIVLWWPCLDGYVSTWFFCTESLCLFHGIVKPSFRTTRRYSTVVAFSMIWGCVVGTQCDCNARAGDVINIFCVVP